MRVRSLLGELLFCLTLVLSGCGGGGGGGEGGPTAGPAPASGLLASGASVSVASSVAYRAELTPGEVQWIRDTLTSTANVQGLQAEIQLVDGGGQPVASQSFSNVAVAAGGATVLQMDYTVPTTLAPGRYTSRLTARDGAGQVLIAQQPGAFFDVAPCPLPQFQACALHPVLSASPLTQGQVQSIQVTLKAVAQLGNVQAQVRVVNAQGTLVASRLFEHIDMAAGATQLLQFDYASPASLPLGTYTVQVGVWSADWATTHHYSTLVAFNVVAPAATPAPVLSNPGNLLPNPGFEDFLVPGDATSQPIAWNSSYAWATSHDWTVVAEAGRGHVMSLRPGGFASTFELQDRLGKDDAVRTYVVTAQLKSANPAMPMAVRLSYRDGTPDAFVPASGSVTGSWAPVTLTFTVDRPLSGAVVQFYNDNSTVSANIYIDDVELRESVAPAEVWVTPSATPAGGIAKPFPQHTPYLSALSVTAPDRDQVVCNWYRNWKAAFVKPDGNNAYVLFQSGNANLAGITTTSEGVGYGMLMTVLMSGSCDPQARDTFDRLLGFAKAHPAYEFDANLMDAMLPRGVGGASNGYGALDGDLDIALALLLADKQWGSAGSINYMQQALTRINAIKLVYLGKNGLVRTNLGGSVFSRTSDYMIGHFRSFGGVTRDAFWDDARTTALALLNTVQANPPACVVSPCAGLVPDWLVGVPGNPAPSPAGQSPDHQDTDGAFAYNAIRLPWRLASDYVLSGDPAVKARNNALMETLRTRSGGVAQNVSVYQLNGTRIDNFPSPSYVGPVMAGILTMDATAQNQQFLDNLWAWSAGQSLGSYYNNELLFFGMLVASGNWWTP